MSFLNIEIKAICPNPTHVRDYLRNHGADFKGIDEQTDTYFNVRQGRLKLREGRIENNLIYYERPDQAGPKPSQFNLVKVEDAAGLKEVLRQSIGIKIVVRKIREIYFIDNVKFHIDNVPALGSFVEIEAGNITATHLTVDTLQLQCETYCREFLIRPEHLITQSYSDMLELASLFLPHT